MSMRNKNANVRVSADRSDWLQEEMIQPPSLPGPDAEGAVAIEGTEVQHAVRNFSQQVRNWPHRGWQADDLRGDVAAGTSPRRSLLSFARSLLPCL